MMPLEFMIADALVDFAEGREFGLIGGGEGTLRALRAETAARRGCG